MLLNDRSPLTFLFLLSSAVNAVLYTLPCSNAGFRYSFSANYIRARLVKAVTRIRKSDFTNAAKSCAIKYVFPVPGGP